MATTRSPSTPPAESAPAAGVQELFYAHGDAVYRLAVMMLGRPDLAEDVVQDTFLKLLRHIEDGRPLDNARGWLLTVAAHGCRDRQRASRRWLPWVADRDLRIAPERPDAREGARLIVDALRHLGARDRALIVLRAEGLTYAEIARVMAIRPISIGRLVARALERLSRLLPAEERRHDIPRR